MSSFVIYFWIIGLSVCSLFENGEKIDALLNLFLIVFSVLYAFVKRDLKINAVSNQRLIVILCFLIVGSWIFGVGVGVLNGNKLEYILSNFFGLNYYLAFPALLILRPSKYVLFRALIIGGLIQFAGAVFQFERLMEVFNSSSLESLVSIADLRTKYSVGYFWCYPVMAITMVILIKGSAEFVDWPIKSAFLNFIFLFGCLLVLILLTMSKGFILGVAFVLVGVIWLLADEYGIKLKVTLILFGVLVGLDMLLNYFLDSYWDLFLNSFTQQDGGNSLRGEQLEFLLNEMRWFGNGLGATLKSGYKRDDMGYGFELTYINLISKLGIFVLPLVAVYIVTFMFLIKKNNSKNNTLNKYIAIGCLPFMVVGIGNPVLLSTTAVAMHCVALYFLTGDKF